MGPAARLVALLALSSAPLAAVACVAPRGDAPAALDDVVARFRYEVPLEIGKTWSNGEDRITVTGIRGTRPRVEVGGQYLVRGTYTLKSADEGEVFFHVKGPSNAGTDLDLQHVPVRRGSGTFSVMHGMSKDGHCHVSLFASKGGDFTPAADVYFGSGVNVLREGK